LVPVAVLVAACLTALIVVGRLHVSPQTIRVGPVNGTAGSTVALPAAPIVSRVDAASVWTGQEWLIWGGITASNQFLDNGASYDPRTRRWRLLPVAPIPGRAGPASVWTGSQWLVVGGTDAAGHAMTSGAVYSPATRQWAATAPAPFAPGQSVPAVWTGHEMIVLSGLDATGTAHAESYDPARNTWRALTPPPGQPTAPYGSAVWTGTRLAVLLSTPSQPSIPPTAPTATTGGQTATPPPTAVPAPAGLPPDSGLFVALYDPGTGSWSRLPTATLANGRLPTLGWTGSQLVALDPGHRSFAYRFGSDNWKPLSSPSQRDLADFVISGPPTWTPSSAIYWSGGRTGLIYNTATDTWTTFPAGNLAPRQDPLLAWTGTELLAWGGLLNTTPRSTGDGISYTPAT
jgi:hypothetical protein